MSSFGEIVWHALSIDQASTCLSVDPDSGLSNGEAARRLQEYGPNQLSRTKRVSAWALLLRQCKNVLVIILFIAVVLSALLGHDIEAIAIGIIILFSVVLGFLQEFRAERAIEALRKMAAPTAAVRREGEEVEVTAVSVVPGDILILAAGDKLSADARVLQSNSLHADEASLTGESVPVEKRTEPLDDAALPLGDRRNMLYSGTTITYGRGLAVVTATAMQTEFGKIAHMIESVETEATPLQKSLDRMGATLVKATLAVVVIVSGLGVLRGESLLDMIIFGIALAVAVVPEALPAVVTISLAIGVQRMAKRHALVRRLPAVETLGSTTVICTDKTGTLTKDEMTVRSIVIAGHVFEVTGSGYEPRGAFLEAGNPITAHPVLTELLRAAVLASDAKLAHHEADGWRIKGDPTEGALVVVAAKADLRKDILDAECPRIAEIPFTSETKRMTTLHRMHDTVTAYAKGAPEVILASCTHIHTDGGDMPLRAEERDKLLSHARTMAGSALRLLAVARKTDATMEDSEHSMTFLGLFGMIDPPRPEAKDAVRRCRQAGIKVVMITGDHPLTAEAVASELGIMQNGHAVTGSALDAMDGAALAKAVETIGVYARVSPAHKLLIVTALQKNGHIVAMTGDGVNDAPALKKADIGIAMGITGTDVTKEAAVMTLTDDNFASIVAAVEEGRGMFGNIKKYLMYLLSSNIGEICLMAAATLLGIPLPLSAVQILTVNLVTDGLPALALAVDPPEHDLMQRPPRVAHGSIFSRRVIALMLTGGFWSMAVNLGLFLWALNVGHSLPRAMTMTFISLVLIQFFKAFSFRSDHLSVFRRPFANIWLNLAVACELILLVLIVHIPLFQTLFGTVSLSMRDWLIVTLLACSVVPVLEGAKWGLRRR